MIREEPPLDAASIPGRTVVVELVLAGAPVCDLSTPFLAYGVLIDSDQDPLTVEDLAATVYHQLGIPAEKELIAPGPRPIEIVKDGEVRKELLL